MRISQEFGRSNDSRLFFGVKPKALPPTCLPLKVHLTPLSHPSCGKALSLPSFQSSIFFFPSNLPPFHHLPSFAHRSLCILPHPIMRVPHSFNITNLFAEPTSPFNHMQPFSLCASQSGKLRCLTTARKYSTPAGSASNCGSSSKRCTCPERLCGSTGLQERER